MDVPHVDPIEWGKDVAHKQIRPIGWFFYYTGAANLYLDYQIWVLHFRWWHPFALIFFCLNAPIAGIANIRELKHEMFIAKERKHHPYKRAPKRAQEK